MCHRNGIILALALFALLFVTGASAEEPAAAPVEGGFFSKLVGAVKKGVTDGVDSGMQMSGNVKVLGYTMQHSDLARSDQPAFCLANADTGKLITVVPVFGRPYQRADGTTGFTQMAQPVDPHHNKIEVNVLNVLPGLNCADLIAKHQLNASSASTGQSNTGSGSGGTSGHSDASTSAVGTITSGKDLKFADCYGRFTEPAEQKQIVSAGMPPDPYKLCMNRVTGAPESLLNLKADNRHMYDLPKGFVTVNGVREDASVAAPTNVQASWDKVDRIKNEGIKKNEADSAARDSANADKDLMRKAAFEKCKPLISGDNSQMDAFKACFKNATK